MDTLLFVGIVAAVVALGSFEWVIIGVALSLIFVAARTNAIPRFRRWHAEQQRQHRAEAKGLEAELRIKDQLEQAGFPVLHNVFLPHPDGSGALTQIDLIALSWQGIEVIEVKAHEGHVNVDPLAAEWEVTYPGGYKALLRNPIRQNNTHVDAVAAFCGNDLPTFNAVIFPGATLSFSAPAEQVFTEIPPCLVNGVPTEELMDAWERLAEMDRACDKLSLQKAHLAALNRPHTYDDPPDVREAKRRARKEWIAGCQAELSTREKCTLVREVARSLLPEATQAQEDAILRYAQSKVTPREIWSQTVHENQIVAAHRRSLGKRWLSDEEYSRARALERKYRGRPRYRGRRTVGNTSMTKGELAFIVGVCIGLLARF